MNVPKLRFSEFNDDYKHIIIGDILKIKSGRDQKQVEDENGIYPILGTGGQIGRTNSFLYDKPSVLIGRKGTINKPQYMETPFWTVDTLFYSDIYKPNIPKYVYYLFLSINWSKYDESTGVPSLSCKTIENVKFSIPTVKEQEKIGNMLSLLDKKIELQSKKIEDLKLYKISNLKTIFKREKFFKKKMKEIGTFVTSNSLGKDILSDSGTPIILYGDLYTKYNEVIKNVNSYTSLTQSNLVKSSINDLIFPTSTTVDSLSLIAPSSVQLDGVIYGGDLAIFKPYKNVNSEFLSYEINHILKKDFSKKAKGTTIIHIQSKDLLECEILMPLDDGKSEKISNLMKCINYKIELESEKLIKLIQIKKGLMQSMFV